VLANSASGNEESRKRTTLQLLKENNAAQHAVQNMSK
jgi:hypothetical protein